MAEVVFLLLVGIYLLVYIVPPPVNMDNHYSPSRIKVVHSQKNFIFSLYEQIYIKKDKISLWKLKFYL